MDDCTPWLSITLDKLLNPQGDSAYGIMKLMRLDDVRTFQFPRNDRRRFQPPPEHSSEMVVT